MDSSFNQVGSMLGMIFIGLTGLAIAIVITEYVDPPPGNPFEEDPPSFF